MADPARTAGHEADGPDRQSDALAPAAERGRTVVADKVVERVAAIAVTEVDAVLDSRTGWTSFIGRGLPRADATVAGGTSRIELEVATAWPAPLARVCAQAREHVTQRVVELTGVAVSRVDVTVADVVHLDSATRRLQ